jgi:hypothetical protein
MLLWYYAEYSPLFKFCLLYMILSELTVFFQMFVIILANIFILYFQYWYSYVIHAVFYTKNCA